MNRATGMESPANGYRVKLVPSPTAIDADGVPVPNSHVVEITFPGVAIDTIDFAATPMVSLARINALAAGDSWLDSGTNILLFVPPGVGKTHLSAALGHALVKAGHRVLFARTTDLVEQLQTARQGLRLAAAIEKLDKYRLLILDDLSYVRKSQAETSVLSELGQCGHSALGLIGRETPVLPSSSRQDRRQAGQASRRAVRLIAPDRLSNPGTQYLTGAGAIGAAAVRCATAALCL